MLSVDPRHGKAAGIEDIAKLILPTANYGVENASRHNLCYVSSLALLEMFG
jgi:hypothetical protein